MKPTRTLLTVLLIATSHLHAQPAALNFDFAGQAHGFTAIFADYPPADAAIYSLTKDWRARPANLAAAPALWMEGTAPGTARLIWNSGTLQTTTTLAPADWTDLANSARPRTVTLGAVPRCFWRVRQP